MNIYERIYGLLTEGSLGAGRRKRMFNVALKRMKGGITAPEKNKGETESLNANIGKSMAKNKLRMSAGKK